jgi:RimJ/RimL family protein N-acetyltransferase
MIELGTLTIDSTSSVGKWKANRKLASEIMSVPREYDRNETESWISKNSNDPNQKLFGIYYTNNNAKNAELIGIYRLMFIDFESRVAEIGLYIGEASFQSKGLGKQVMNLGLKYAFQKLKLNKLYARIRSDNEKSIKTFKKFGFELEGVLQQHYFDHQTKKFDDIHLVSLFENQYKSLQ